ncbi:exodeoxyribonuclease III [bacterium AH-315-C07]|nr:exodeoxyribonuclease III [bacterium AH-315-C07]
MKLISWNVNGIRAVAKKGFFESIKSMNVDVVCLQETKAQDDQVAEVLAELPAGHSWYCNSAIKKGYSGTAIITREEPINVMNDIGIEEHDQEGRVIAAEYNSFYLITAYVPNSQSELKRLDYRHTWNEDLLKYLKELEKKKPIVLCGDLNVAHQEIDLKNPKSNYNKTAGYTQVEIDDLTSYLNAGFVDTFRAKNPDKVAYSWWSYRFNARAKNVGWRIDYFLVSQEIFDKVTDTFILPDYHGSDHCPVGLEISLN